MDTVIEDWLSEVISSGVIIDLDNNNITFYVFLNRYSNVIKKEKFDLDELIDMEEIKSLSSSEKIEFIQDHTEDSLVDWVNENIGSGFNLVK